MEVGFECSDIKIVGESDKVESAEGYLDFEGSGRPSVGQILPLLRSV